MFEAIVDGALVVLDYFRNVHLGILSFIDRYRDGIEFLSCGLMFGSGAVLPPLSPESLGLGGLCKAYVFIPILGLFDANNRQYARPLGVIFCYVHMVEENGTRCVI